MLLELFLLNYNNFFYSEAHIQTLFACVTDAVRQQESESSNR